MKPGDIVLVKFPFTDFSSEKLRPAAVILPEDEEGDFLLAFITSVPIRRNPLDLPLVGSPQSGLKRDSLVRLKKIMSVHRSLVEGRIGSVSTQELESMKSLLRTMLGI